MLIDITCESVTFKGQAGLDLVAVQNRDGYAVVVKQGNHVETNFNCMQLSALEVKNAGSVMTALLNRYRFRPELGLTSNRVDSIIDKLRR